MVFPRHTRTLLVLAIFFISMAVLALVSIQKLEHSASIALAKQNSSLLVNTMNLMRVSYSERVIAKVRDHTTLRVGPNHLFNNKCVPNPATFAIELADSLTNSEEGLIVRLFSHYPFPNRSETGGPQDQFEREALQSLLADPNTPFVRHEDINGIETFRYAEAITMQQSCVDCHNSHPQSPKMDWEVGEVRGVLEVTQPLYTTEASVAATIRYAYQAFSVLAIISLFSMLFAVQRVHRISGHMEDASNRAKRLSSIAYTDTLTKIPNRRAFETRLKMALDSLGRTTHCALALFDLDHFKRINDNYGHDEGDRCLRAVAETAKTMLRRADDFIARYGGEEFIMLLPDIDESKAAEVAERIRQALETLRVGEHKIQLTASFGIAATRAENRENGDQLLKRADEALYQAKANGRNQVFIHKSSNQNPNPTNQSQRTPGS